MTKSLLITIFGGTGFLGTYVVKELAKTGATIRVVSRNPDRALQLKTAGSPGQIALMQGNIRNQESVKTAVEGAEIVINLVGLMSEHGKQNFSAIHAQAAESLAKAAKNAGTKRFIHISALGADKPSHSKYARTKLNGEKAVIAAFPNATIVRPGILFGPEDNFFNRFACMAALSPFLPLIGGGRTKFQPVYVGDIAKAIAAIAANDMTAGKIYELGGPSVYTFHDLMEILLSMIGHKRLLLPVPFFLAFFWATFLELLPSPLLTRDQVQLLKRDNVVNGASLTFDHLAIKPTNLESVLPGYLERYRSIQ